METLNKLIPLMPFDIAQEILVEGLNQSFLMLTRFWIRYAALC
jgi:hypothetical protein